MGHLLAQVMELRGIFVDFWLKIDVIPYPMNSYRRFNHVFKTLSIDYTVFSDHELHKETLEVIV
jgi:hypothetical protein